ncbi:MAG: hypothetical protein DWQ37_04405 [Planctomycetota bacterium]|nr:MAG: hypothetical protein DWQ37_04405 [Planctomycetota bacterium]
MSNYVRFETPYYCDLSSQPLGIFWAANQVASREQMCDWSRQWLRESLRWFHRNLPAPWTDVRDRRAIFWFRSRSGVVREIWHLVAILREEGVPVRKRSTQMPGRIVYDDAFQIAAIPYGHGRRHRKPRLPYLT